jgi:hypothetical protein
VDWKRERNGNIYDSHPRQTNRELFHLSFDTFLLFLFCVRDLVCVRVATNLRTFFCVSVCSCMQKKYEEKASKKELKIELGEKFLFRFMSVLVFWSSKISWLVLAIIYLFIYGFLLTNQHTNNTIQCGLGWKVQADYWTCTKCQNVFQ